MAFIDVVSWDDSSSGFGESGPVFAFKFPQTNLSTMTQLIVRESQEAVLFSKGQLIGKFGPGKHTLNTENLPLLRSLYGLPFGGRNPFFAEVWFVNKVTPLNIDWKTSSMMLHDPDYQAMVPIRAVGRYGLKVQDAERFLIKLVGAAPRLVAHDLTEHFDGPMNARTKSVLISYMQAQHLGIKSISAYLDPLSQALKASMLAFWEDYGFTLEGFYVTSIEVDSDDAQGRMILDAIARQSAQAIGGYSWQQSKAFEVAENAVSSVADGKGGMLGALMLTGMMGAGASGAVGSLLQPSPAGVPASGAPGAPTVAAAPVPRTVFCSNCSKKYANSSKFCPHCGNAYRPCPQCGSDNDKDARRCVSCGTSLVSAAHCPACGLLLPPGAATCPRCVRAVGGSASCSQCGARLAPADAFCSECGKKVE
jgi:membrane protease subunit (stomatin/prohibitin family)